MKKLFINRILKEYVMTESLIYDDNSFIDEIDQIKRLSEQDPEFENKLDKIWNTLEIKVKKSGGDMSNIKTSVNTLLKMFVEKLKDQSKNPAVWIRRYNVCKLWK
jgi:uncharacterized membrane-anchored protein YjiN (DUF445 family)